MREQGYSRQQQYDDAADSRCPDARDLQPPGGGHAAPVLHVLGQAAGRRPARRRPEGARPPSRAGCAIRTTIDRELQDAAEEAIDAWLPYRDGPRAALVAIDNSTGEVRAMVGGDDDATTSAVQPRHPGPAPARLGVQAVHPRRGAAPGHLARLRVGLARSCSSTVPSSSKEIFTVNNYEDAYSGITTLARATTFSDNSVFAQVGIKIGTRKIARLAERMGIRTHVSTN